MASHVKTSLQDGSSDCSRRASTAISGRGAAISVLRAALAVRTDSVAAIAIATRFACA